MRCDRDGNERGRQVERVGSESIGEWGHSTGASKFQNLVKITVLNADFRSAVVSVYTKSHDNFKQKTTRLLLHVFPHPVLPSLHLPSLLTPLRPSRPVPFTFFFFVHPLSTIPISMSLTSHPFPFCPFFPFPFRLQYFPPHLPCPVLRSLPVKCHPSFLSSLLPAVTG